MSGFSINVAVHSGNLTRDPELRSLPSGSTLCRLGVAVNERYKDSATGEWTDRANYFDWTVWGGIGEWVAANCRQGDGITLEGRARWRSWEDDQGNKRSAVEFVADSVIPRKSGGGGFTARDEKVGEQNAALDSDVPGAKDDEFVTPAGAGAKDDSDDIPF